jgi:hypothetical protein
MALARLTGFGAVTLGAALAVFLPDVDGAAYAGLVGWAGALLLATGVWYGEEAAIVLSAIAFAIKVTILSALTGPVDPPVWAQALIVVLIVELASLSVEARAHGRLITPALGRVAVAALTAMIVSVGLEALVYGTEGSGTTLRIGAVAAVVFVGGWLTMAWRRATD